MLAANDQALPELEQAILARFRQPVVLAERSGRIVYANPRASNDCNLRVGDTLSASSEIETQRLLRNLIRAASSDQWTPLNLALPGGESDGPCENAKFLASGLQLDGREPLVILMGDSSRDTQFARLSTVMAQLDREQAANKRLRQQLDKALERLAEREA